MDVTFVANDTRGGVEPYLALAAEAATRGHVVRAVAPPQYETEFVAAGVRFGALRGAEQAQSIAAGARVSLREMRDLVVELTAQWAVDAVHHADGTDVVVAGIGGAALARPVAQAVGARFLRAHLQPLDAPSTTYPGPLAPQLEAFGRLGRRLSHSITAAGTSVLTHQPERSARTALGLTGSPQPAMPAVAYGFSRRLVPVASDARTTRVATGYWAQAAPARVDPDLARFVGRPGPVVSIGFGSMRTPDPGELRRVVTGAARRAGARVVLLTGWGALDDSNQRDDDVFVASAVSHAWLFPRMSATVHHGGAGTTGAALTAGKPTVIVPFGADQAFWASRAHRLGVSPPPIRRGRLTETRLAQALSAVLTDSDMRRRATALGTELQRERGVADAIDLIEAASRAQR